MIIDGQAEFRSLLLHHVTTRWPDAIVSAYDPVAGGHLPAEFSGAGNDIVLLGEHQGDRDPRITLEQFTKQPGFPPVVYFGDQSRFDALRTGASAAFDREHIAHDALVSHIDRIMRAKHSGASPESLFVGDPASGIRPLVRGYRFIRQLAAGAHSAMYLAEKEPQGETVALKVLHQVPDYDHGPAAVDRFIQEYEIIAELEHRHIVKIHDLGVSDDHVHIAMEYLPGGDLAQQIRRGVTETQAHDYARQIASALDHLHSAGILHRDLTPGNVMLRGDGTVALIDFGLAKKMQVDAGPTGNRAIFGTPSYMSPEQGRGNDVDARSDLYALGIILCEMLTGKKPFAGDDAMTVIFKHSEAPLPVLPEPLSGYQPVIDALLAKKPQDRVQSAATVLEWL